MKITKTIEVEVRGPLTKGEFLRVSAFFAKNAKFKSQKDRILIDYSTFIKGQELKARKKDIRLRTTNGVSEIIIKLGSWGSNENREEISVLARENSFDDLVRIFGALGLEKGMLCVRNSAVFDFKGVEFALVEVPNHSYYFEAEMMCNTDGVTSAQKKIHGVVEELGLKVFSERKFFSYVKVLNKEANKHGFAGGDTPPGCVSDHAKGIAVDITPPFEPTEYDRFIKMAYSVGLCHYIKGDEPHFGLTADLPEGTDCFVK